MAQTTLSPLLPIASPAPAQPPGARGGTDDAGAPEAFSRVLDKRLGAEKPAAPAQASQPVQRKGSPGKDTGQAAPAEKGAGAPASPDATSASSPPSSPLGAVGAELAGQVARFAQDAGLPAASSEPTTTDLPQPEPTATDDPLQASLAGLPAALAALLAAGSAPAAAAPAQGEAQATPASTARAAATPLAGLLAEAARGLTKSEAPTGEAAPAANTAKPEATSTFADVLAEASSPETKPAFLSSAEAGPDPAAAAPGTAQPTGNPATAEAGPAANPTPNPNASANAALAWAAAPGRAHAEDTAVRLTVSQPPGHPAWAEAVGNKVSWLVGQHESKADLVLTPPQLGRVEVTISVTGDQTTAQFVAATPAAREALEHALPRLREVLAEAGIQLSQSGVSTSDQQGSGGENRRPNAGRRAGDVHPVGPADSPGRPLPRTGHGLVDTFA